jgi:hypothetical protein
MKGISSVYGFIMIFLLSMASIQTWSSAVGAMESIQGASDQSAQLHQLQGIEHLSLSLYAGNLTITNDGQVASTVEFLRLVGANSSRTIAVNSQVGVGDSLKESVPPGYAVQAVSSLGNVFTSSLASDPPGSVWSGPSGNAGGENAQLFEDVYDPSLFFLSSGSRVDAFSGSGSLQWSFNAGVGIVTDVMPISTGQIFVSVGYATISNTAQLYELDSSGRVVALFPVRLLAYPSGPDGPYEQPVAKGVDSGFVYYDGWFYSAAGPVGAIAGDTSLLASVDSSDFYFYTTSGDPNFPACQSWGNTMVIYSYTPGANYPGGVTLNWDDYVYLGACNAFPQQLLSASTGGGTFVALFADPYFSQSYYDPYPGENPYVVAISDSGQVVYQGVASSAGCSAVATDGSSVYMAVPQAKEIQVLDISTGAVTTYPIGIAASDVVWRNGILFAISNGAVKVFDGSMDLKKTIDFGPFALSSTSDSFPFEAALNTPSFLVLNNTAYAALVENATGSSSLIVGRYA